MDFIELMRDVWMTAEMRKREEEAWARKKEEQQWQNNERGEQGGKKAPENLGTGLNPTVDAEHVRRQPTDFQSELNRVVGLMARGSGKPSTDFKSGEGSSHIEGASNTTMPPGYDIYQNFSSPLLSSQTELKRCLSNDAKSTSSGSDHSSRGPDDTHVKTDYVSEGDNGAWTMTPEEKADLLDTIKKLSEEQHLLRTKISEHDERFASLLTKKPSIRKRLSAKPNQIVLTSKMSPMENCIFAADKQINTMFGDEDVMYAQIEQLYANLCRINFPRRKTAAQCLPLDENQIYSVPSSDEMELRMENENLKKKISDLENRLKATNVTSTKKTECTDIESLKFTSLEDCTSVCYENLKSIDTETTTDFNIECPLHPSKRDVKQIASTFEWRISEYSEKLRLEKRGKVTNTMSEPFYVGNGGYRARLEVYLNGNGSGYDKCMSIFLRIIQGQCDDYLPWPAIFSLTFILVNQEEKLTESLVHGKDGTVFKYCKPLGDTHDDSDSWGLIEFVPHAIINKRKYIKDDAIKLKVKIHNNF